MPELMEHCRKLAISAVHALPYGTLQSNYPITVVIGWHALNDRCVPQETTALAHDREHAARIVANYLGNIAVKSISVTNL